MNEIRDESEYPYISECKFCYNGMVRFWLCPNCSSLVGLCDECELIWIDIKGLYENNDKESDGAFPSCPKCKANLADGHFASEKEIDYFGLKKFIKGFSS